jgi:hypothetical protein
MVEATFIVKKSDTNMEPPRAPEEGTSHTGSESTPVPETKTSTPATTDYVQAVTTGVSNSLKEAPPVPPLPDANDAITPNTGKHDLAMSLVGPTICPPALPMTLGTALPQGAAKKAAKRTKTPKRECRFPGCTRHVKSQGHCQRHGAQAKRCKVPGCTKQAQGTHDGMCKRHWKEVNLPQDSPKPTEPPLPEPLGDSVYDSILPLSVAWKPSKKKFAPGEKEPTMPLIDHLRAGVDTNQPTGWHRADERAARGCKPIPGNSVQFEPWERQLVMFETFLITGIVGHSFKDLAHGWGREKGFHTILINQICERRGEMERKKRSDSGRTFTAEQKLNFRTKLNKTRGEKRKRIEDEKNVTAVPMLPQDYAMPAPAQAQQFNPPTATQVHNFNLPPPLMKHDVNSSIEGATDNGVVPVGNPDATSIMDTASAAAAAAIDELKEEVIPVEVPPAPIGEAHGEMSQVVQDQISI